MKKFVEQARDLTKMLAGKLQQAVEPPLPADATPLEIRYHVIEAIERRVQPAGGGRRVFPDGVVRVTTIAENSETRRAQRAALDDVTIAAAARLRELDCAVPQGFHVEVTYLDTRPPSWPADAPVTIEFAEPAVTTDRRTPDRIPTLTLTVLRGSATRPSYTFNKAVVHLGRTETPQDDRGRSRTNDVAFLEDGDERSATVTRGHCVLRYDRTRDEYRVFDERSANGTRVVRGGEPIEVPPGDPIGVALMSGDELQLGKASLEVRIERDADLP